MRILRDMIKDGKFRFGFFVLISLVILSLLSFVSPYDITIWNVGIRDRPPSWDNLLGTNSRGQDVFWEMTFAIRNSLTIALFAAFFSRIIAVIIGLIAGFSGGRIDKLLMSLNDSVLVLPLLPILILVSSLLRGRLDTLALGLMLGFFGWAWDARVIRSQILKLRERGFTFTAMISGTSTIKLVVREYLPHVTPLVFATIMNNMSWAVGMEVTLALLGLSDFEMSTLGTMLHWAISYQSMLLGIWWWILTPVTVSILLFVGLYLLSVSISEYLDPRTRAQRIGTARSSN